jgi:hypothetical protein
MAGLLAGVAAGPASATYRLPTIPLLCSAAANGGTPENGVCVLPFGVTTAPKGYSAAIAVSNPAAGHNAGGALSIGVGALPTGLSMLATFGPSGDIAGGTATQLGTCHTCNFTVQATQQFSLPIQH